ncbi:MAG: YlmH/Sll1252 family protein, partial [Eubacteriales bacterium]
MTKTQLLNQFSQDREERTLFAHGLDKAEQSQGFATSTPFFTAEERERFTQLLNASGIQNFHFSGGYDGAVRQICTFYPPWEEEVSPLPLKVVEATFYGTLSHSDLLGGLMGIGLTRQKFGDILVGEKFAHMVVLEDVAPIVLSQWSSAGREKLSLTLLDLCDLKQPEQKVKEIRDTVSTMRLDSVVASGFSLSRSKASSYISGGKVQRNHIECTKPDKLVEEGDILTCRGLGKCLVSEVLG